MKKILQISNVLFATMLLLSSCDTTPIARPMGHMRIGLPNAEAYVLTPSPMGCPISFERNEQSKINLKDSSNCWIDVYFPTLRSTVQLTYKPVGEDFEAMVRDAQKLAYKHTIKASGMREQFFAYPEKKMYGMYYEMSGASAATTQFYATDSTHHFLRGVLYHYSVPNPDSLQPVTDFMRSEILHLIETLEWTNTPEDELP
ncbi:MAG: gliding motility lipoprotein GldD [Bacteroidota bacterium]|jgi:gliding motility-associated lipoprotein GldD